jgi:hypothetical protein
MLNGVTHLGSRKRGCLGAEMLRKLSMTREMNGMIGVSIAVTRAHRGGAGMSEWRR